MATTPQTPLPGSTGVSSPGAPTGGTPPMGAASPASAPAAQKLARLAMDAEQIAKDNPETAPMMREIQNKVREAMMKMIQQRAATQQATPPI